MTGTAALFKWLKTNPPSTERPPPLTQHMAYMCGVESMIILDAISDPSRISRCVLARMLPIGALRLLGHLPQY